MEGRFSALALAALVPALAFSQIIPPDRTATWTPGVTVGVPGGMPHRVDVGVVVDSAVYGTGLIDASEAIGAAIDACPTDKVVYIPSGTYRLDNRVYRPYASNITIRGAGPGKTILKAHSGQEVLLLGTGDWPRPIGGIAVTAGATKGSARLTVSNPSAISVGSLVRIEQDDLPYVISATAPGSNNRLVSATFLVTGKEGSVVSLSAPLPFDFTEFPTMVQYSIAPLTSTGVEDLTVDCNGLAWVGIEINQSWGCWIQNVEVKNSTSRQIFLTCFVAGEIRHNFTHDVVGGGPNHEGIDLYEDCSFNLIEDNITYNGGFPGIILGDSRGGCAGNVIAYNFCYAGNTGSSDMAGMDISVSHGPHNMMNLVEGNIAGGIGSDGYFGSTSHITIARNWATATHPTAADNLIAVNIGRWNTYFNIVGNTLGTSSFSQAGQYMPYLPFSYSVQTIYKLGFPNMGNNSFSLIWGPTSPPDYRFQAAHQKGGDSHGNGGNTLQELDMNVWNSMFRHGNYDHLRKSILWDTSMLDHTIPPSYFRSEKPVYFGNLAWPPFDPEIPPGDFSEANIGKIPAGYRFVTGKDPVTSVVPRGNAIPSVARLEQNYPNPFNPTTEIQYTIHDRQSTSIKVFDLLGREVASLVNGLQSPGSHVVRFDARGLASGVYYYRLTAGGSALTRMMVLAK
jgi:hypothetical protein